MEYQVYPCDLDPLGTCPFTGMPCGECAPLESAQEEA